MVQLQAGNHGGSTVVFSVQKKTEVGMLMDVAQKSGKGHDFPMIFPWFSRNSIPLGPRHAAWAAAPGEAPGRVRARCGARAAVPAAAPQVKARAAGDVNVPGSKSLGFFWITRKDGDLGYKML